MPTADPSIPAAATARSEEGAQEFTRYFLAQVNRSLVEANPGLLPPLFTDTCRSCQAWQERATDLKQQGRHLEADLYTPSLIQTTSLTGATAGVLVTGRQQGTRVVDAAGNPVDTVPAENGRFIITLSYTDAWRVSAWRVAG